MPDPLPEPNPKGMRPPPGSGPPTGVGTGDGDDLPDEWASVAAALEKLDARRVESGREGLYLSAAKLLQDLMRVRYRILKCLLEDGEDAQLRGMLQRASLLASRALRVLRACTRI